MLNNHVPDPDRNNSQKECQPGTTGCKDQFKYSLD